VWKPLIIAIIREQFWKLQGEHSHFRSKDISKLRDNFNRKGNISRLVRAMKPSLGYKEIGINVCNLTTYWRRMRFGKCLWIKITTQSEDSGQKSNCCIHQFN
jgi:hypothetical protein